MTKYIGPKTDGENVATQADKLSLSSETPDALTPDQTGAAGTATTAARSDHQHEILAGAAGTITGTNAEGSSTSFARADHNHAYGNGSIPQAALALGPTYETSLPGSPVDGQEIYYAADATNSIIWHLRYRSAARSNSGAWEYVGGPPLTHEVTAEQDRANLTYGDLTTTGPQIALPLKGDYRVFISAFCLINSAGNVQAESYMSYSIGATAASDDDRCRHVTLSYVSNNSATIYDVSRERVKTGLDAVTLTMKYRTNSASATGKWANRYMRVTPIRVWS